MSGSLLLENVEPLAGTIFERTGYTCLLTPASANDVPPKRIPRAPREAGGVSWANVEAVTYVVPMGWIQGIADSTLGITTEEAADFEEVIPHTSRPMSAAQLARMLDAVSRPAKRESAPLGFDPDDYPLF